MAITNIQVNFTPCVPAPVGGYNIVYRVVGDPTYIDGGNYMTSPANITVSYPDGTLFEGIVHSPCGDVVWSTVPISNDCGCRFAYPGEDELAGEIRAFEQAGFSFSIYDGGGPNVTLQLDPANGSYQLGKNVGNGAYFSANAVSNIFTAQASNANYITMDGANSIFHVVMAGGFDHLNLDAGTGVYEIGDISAFGIGNNNYISINDAAETAFFRIAQFNGANPGDVLTLVSTVTGEVEWGPGGGGSGSGSGGAMMRFAYPSEDDTAGEERLFNLGTLHRIHFIGNFDTAVWDSVFKVTNQADNGQAILGIGVGTAGAIRGISDGGYAGQFTSTDGIGSLSASVNALGAMISSVNNIGAQISSDGTYSTSCQVSAASNNSVLPNVLLGAITINAPAEDGFGQSLDFQTNTLDAGTIRTSNQIISRWTIADDTTGQSELKITGVAAGALWDLISIQGDGIFVFLQGLFDYADDTAAAAGTPIIPIGGLYRTGNAVQIRLT